MEIRFGLLRLVASAVLVFVSGNVCAKSFFYTEVLPRSIVLHDVEQVVVLKLDNNVANDEGCAKNNELVLQKAHPLFDEIYAALLASFYSGNGIKGVVSGCFIWNQPILVRVDLMR